MALKKYSVYEAAAEFYNLFFDGKNKISLIDYLDNSFCDEIGEIDTTDWTFKFLYHVSNKFANPVIQGDYSEFYDYILNNVFH